MKKKYQVIDDFLHDDQFVKWVLFDENPEYWNQFGINNPELQELMNQSKNIIISISEKENYPYINKEQIWNNLQNEIENQEEPEKKSNSFKYIAIAASILLFLSLFIWQQLHDDPKSYQHLVTEIKDNSNIIEKSNTSNQPQKIVLNDGSVVTLSPNSKISFPEVFTDNKRVVVLNGDAKFEVQKNPSKPFYVYSDEIITRVLGTVFRINASENATDIKVTVESGKVSVSKNVSGKEQDNGLILLPNQLVIFNKPNKMFTKSLVEVPKVIIETKAAPINLKYVDAPISSIFNELQKIYGIEIKYDAEKMASCHITTTLNEELFFDQLTIICKTIGATYQSVDGVIQIESNGCN